MTTRERWIVYPLLFLSIGIAVSNGFELQERSQQSRGATDVNVLRCKALEVVGADGRPRLSMGTGAGGHAFLQLGAQDGTLEAQLETNPSGALLSLFDRSGKIGLRLGHDAEQVVLTISGPLGTLVRPGFSVALPDRTDGQKTTGGSESADESKPNAKSPAQEPQPADAGK